MKTKCFSAFCNAFLQCSSHLHHDNLFAVIWYDQMTKHPICCRCNFEKIEQKLFHDAFSNVLIERLPFCPVILLITNSNTIINSTLTVQQTIMLQNRSTRKHLQNTFQNISVSRVTTALSVDKEQLDPREGLQSIAQRGWRFHFAVTRHRPYWGRDACPVRPRRNINDSKQ